MVDWDREKQVAAARSMAYVEAGQIVGLGTGSTASHAIRMLGRRVREGLTILGVPTSEQTRRLAEAEGIPLLPLEQTTRVDLTIDGADEVDPQLRLIKGGGGALLREKIVISAARRFVVVAETPKRVDQLGEHHRLPVEVARFAWRDTRRRLSPLLPDAVLRTDDGEPYRTDEGHYLLDCVLRPGIDVDALADELERVPGVVEHGLFIGMAERVLLGRPDGGVDVLSATS
jgi:ribose 5-phosphate isomerase A